MVYLRADDACGNGGSKSRRVVPIVSDLDYTKGIVPQSKNGLGKVNSKNQTLNPR